MMSYPSLRSGSWLMFDNGSLRSGGGFTCPWTTAIGSRTSLDRSSVSSRERMDVVDFHWLGGLVSGENPFSFPTLSKAEPFWFLAFPFLISPSSVRSVSLTPLVAYFALSLLSFLPNFQVRPSFTLSFLSEFCLYLCLLSSFFFLCFPFFFSSSVVSL